MARSKNLVEALKQLLKLSGITYGRLAQQLGLSESAVKQMFAASNLSLKRLDKICDILKIDITDLVDIAENRQAHIASLGIEQEQQLIADNRLMLMAYCLVNHWSVEDILSRYAITQHESIQLLARLDRLGLIDLLPGNRVRLKIQANFSWISGGPIEQFFRHEVQGEFLDSSLMMMVL